VTATSAGGDEDAMIVLACRFRMVYTVSVHQKWLKELGKGGSSMRAMKEIIEDAESLPVEERVIVIDSLLQTINPMLADVEAEWVNVAKRRLAELRSGRVKAVPGEEVFARIRNRFER
jgi:putative addiction module component (TIGR02574 family)